ncbi:GNAT family N-acetyltransferase [Agrococcus sp. BE272]|uniref:GNAT family N-acetyltransferase n=1 Tax=Agrococcus sp. BE272 TaxID=2817727 RepID=UPI002862CA51|nr:GNAT family N-acetyltransferase [Agrococcus sp. BE272]MDR7234387.1 GNAT superfamily N-acetyltransferase [Agrococcus sp. BE272]
MAVTLATPGTTDLGGLRDALAAWQVDHGPVQLHPGDLGWHALRGATATAAALRVWRDRGRVVAMALLDGPDLLRFGVDPGHREDDALAQRIVADLDDVEAGVLPAGPAAVEARGAAALGARLATGGWVPDEPWTPLHRDLRAPVDAADLQIETLDPADTAEWAEVHWSAFRGAAMPHDRRRRVVEGWLATAGTPLFDGARILAGRDTDGRMVAVAAVWAAGRGRPGLIEPMGVHAEHRGKGYGAIVTRAAAAALRDLGASSATVCTESANAAAVATYTAAGFAADPQVADWSRST